MSDPTRITPGREPDAGRLDAVSGYLELTPESLERLQVLRDRVHATLSQEFGCVTADLQQLRSILSDAAAKLSGTFRVVTASSDELRRTLGGIHETSDLPALQRLQQISAEMSSTSGTTVQSLQFEDMATQLLQHVDRKLAVLASLARDMAVIGPTAARVAPQLPAGRLDELFAELERYETELSTATRKVVQQQSLESGDIELF